MVTINPPPGSDADLGRPGVVAALQRGEKALEDMRSMTTEQWLLQSRLAFIREKIARDCTGVEFSPVWTSTGGNYSQ